MRLATTLQIAGAAAMAALPAMAAAAPARAAAALPTGGAANKLVSVAAPVRASTPAEKRSALIGFPILIFVGVFTTAALVAVLVSGPGRSPG